MCNVSKGRVTQWITAGLIDGAAIVGEGRSAAIDVDIARAQLKERRAGNESCGLNGLSTNISTTTISPRPVRAKSETFRHRIPAEARRARSAEREAADAAKAARAVAPSSAQNCRTMSARARGSGRLKVVG